MFADGHVEIVEAGDAGNADVRVALEGGDLLGNEVEGDIDIAALFLQCRRATIYAGSSEIQRNVLAKRVLNLPG